jgi:hypothetical protein
VVCLADTVILKDGRKIEGEIVEETAEKYVVKTKFGVQQIDKIDVERVEHEKSDSQIYEEKKKAANDAESHYQLAQWCKEKGLTKEAEDELKRTIELDPNHEKARKELGYQKVGDKWLTEDEAMEAKGFKKWESRWVSESEYQELLKKKEEKDKLEEQKRSEEQKNAVQKAQEKSKKEYEGVLWEQRHVIETAHFTINCNSTRQVAEKYAKLMEWLYAKYSTIFGDFRPVDRKCTINIHRNHQEFMQMYGAPAGVGGFYSPGEFRLCAFHGTFGIGGDASMVLAHEGCHLFQDLIGMFGDTKRGISKSPIWLLEGLAVVFEAAEINWRTGKVRLRGVNRDRLLALKRELEDKKAIPLRDVVNCPRQQFSGRHYGYAGMFSYWLLTGATEKHKVLYSEYVKIATGWGERQGRVIQPGDFENLLQQYLNKSLSDVEQDWQRWVLKQKIEKLGAMKGNKYVSKETGFEVEKPDPSWKADTENELEGAEQVAFISKNTSGRISVSAQANFMNYTLENLKDELKRGTERQIAEGKLKDYKLISENTYSLKGHEVYDIVLEATNPESRINTTLQRRRVVYFVMVDDLYSVRLMSDPDKFDENNKMFEKVLQTFQIYLK